MSTNLSHLLTTRRFLPLFLTQFLVAFNDNLLKNSLTILIIYGSFTIGEYDPKVFVTLAGGLFILPYVLFSATAGQLADKIEKSFLVRKIKLVELTLMLIAAAGFYFENIWFMMVVLFGMGAQSAFFSPLKYSLVPDHLEDDEIMGGNAWLEAGTFLSILTGTITGGLLVTFEAGPLYVAASLVTLALCGIITARFIPPSGPFEPELRVNPNIPGETLHLLKEALKSYPIRFCILGISWFWFVGATIFTQLPALTKLALGGDEKVITLLLTLFSIGIAIGSFLSQRLTKGAVSVKYVPYAMAGITLFTVDLYFASQGMAEASLLGVSEFIARSDSLRAMLDITLLAICGGLFIVPLNAMLQVRAPCDTRARIIAANNVVNALYMVLSSLLGAALLSASVAVPEIFLGLGLLNIVALLWMRAHVSDCEIVECR